MKTHKIRLMGVLLLLTALFCMASCSLFTKNADVIVAHQSDIYDENGIISKTWTINFKEKYIDSMHMEMTFQSEEEAQNFFAVLSNEYKDYPQYDLKLSGSKITYNPYDPKVDAVYWPNYTYDDMLEAIDKMGGWTIER